MTVEFNAANLLGQTGLTPVTILLSAEGYESTRHLVQVTDRPGLSWSVPQLDLVEGSAAIDVVLTRGDSTGPVEVELSTSVPGRLELPETVQFADGETEALVRVAVVDNAVFDVVMSLEIFASAINYEANTLPVRIEEDDGLILRFPAETLAEGSNGDATIERVGTPGGAVTVSLLAQDAELLQLPSQITLAEGINQVAMPYEIGGNLDVQDGDRAVTFTAFAEELGQYQGTVTITDATEVLPRIILSVDETDLTEGGTSATVTLSTDTVLTDNVLAEFSASSVNQIAFPTGIVLSPQNPVVTFTIQALIDEVEDAGEVQLTAAADGLQSAAIRIQIVDAFASESVILYELEDALDIQPGMVLTLTGESFNLFSEDLSVLFSDVEATQDFNGFRSK